MEGWNWLPEHTHSGLNDERFRRIEIKDVVYVD